MKWLAGSALVMALATAVLNAQIYYVSPTGSDNSDGSSSSPFCSIYTAVTAANARTDCCLIDIAPGHYTNSMELLLGNERVMLRGSGMAQTHLVGDVIITADLHVAALLFDGAVSNAGTLLCQDVKLQESPTGEGYTLGLWHEGESDIQHLTWLADTMDPLDAVNYQTLTEHAYSSFTNLAAVFALAGTNWVANYLLSNTLILAESIIDARGRALSNVMDIVLSLPPASSATVYSVFEHSASLFDTTLAQAPPVGTTPRFVKFISGVLAGQCRGILSCSQGSWNGGVYYTYSVDASAQGLCAGDSFEVYDTDPRLGRTLADVYVRRSGGTIAGDLWYDVPTNYTGSLGVRGADGSRVALYGCWAGQRVATEYCNPSCAAPYYLGFLYGENEVGLYQNSLLAPFRVGYPSSTIHAATKGYVDSRVLQSTNIADGAVTSVKMADGAISASKLASDVDDRYVAKSGDAMTGALTVPEICVSNNWVVGNGNSRQVIAIANEAAGSVSWAAGTAKTVTHNLAIANAEYVILVTPTGDPEGAYWICEKTADAFTVSNGVPFNFDYLIMQR